jgi:hypothetical protein
VAEPVLLISSDPFLGASLEAVACGRVRVASLDPPRRPVPWPAEPTATVVLDVAAGQRDALHAWVRRHHPGPLVVLLKPGERRPPPPPEPGRVVVARPFRLADLVELLEHPQAPPAPGQEAPAADLLEVRPPPPALRGRRVAARAELALLVLLVVAAAWLALGLLGARQDLLAAAGAVRSELARAEAAMAAGRTDEAAAAVQDARRSLEVAAAVPDRRELRVAARLPVLSGGVADTRRLLAAGSGLTGAGQRAVAVAAYLGSGRGAPRGRDALDDATAQARRGAAELERVRVELERVRGGRFAPGVDQARRWALERLGQAETRARDQLAALEARAALDQGG